MTLVMRRFEFDAAHRVARHESMCSTLHGHRYAAELVVSADELDTVDRVIDFGEIKAVVGKWIGDHLDHTTIVGARDLSLLEFVSAEALALGKRKPFVVDGEPTAEVIAAIILAKARVLLASYPVDVVRVTLWETPNCAAVAQ